MHAIHVTQSCLAVPCCARFDEMSENLGLAPLARIHNNSNMPTNVRTKQGCCAFRAYTADTLKYQYSYTTL